MLEIQPMDLCLTDDGYVIVVTDIAAEPETLVRFFFTERLLSDPYDVYQPVGEAHVTDRKFIVQNISGDHRRNGSADTPAVA